MAELVQHDTGWRLDWRELPGAQLWIWWDQIWKDAIQLRDRYKLPLRSGWWRNDVQVETLAALAAMVSGYDQGTWNDPIAKLQLLQQLDQIRALLRDGDDVFDPQRDRDRFVAHLTDIGCLPPAHDVDLVSADER